MKKGVRKFLTFLLVFSMIAGMGVSFAYSFPSSGNFSAKEVFLLGEDFVIAGSTNSQSNIPAFWFDSSDNLLIAFSIHHTKQPTSTADIELNGDQAEDFVVYSTTQQAITVNSNTFLAGDYDGGANPGHKWLVVDYGKVTLEKLVEMFDLYLNIGAGGHNIGDSGKLSIVITNYYLIEYIADSGGTISGDTSQVVEEGEDTTSVTAVPNSGYTFSGWNDGNTNATRNETNVTSDATYTAYFTQLDNITINYEATTGGTVSRPSESMNPETGVAQGSTATASSGYEFINWTLEGVEVSTSLTYVPAKVDDLNVPATYVANFRALGDITINYEATTGGTVSRASESMNPETGVAQGSTATASSGYEFINWTLEGVEVSTSLTYVPAKVDGLNVPATYVANFRALGDITINYEATTGGTVSRASESMNPETGVAQGSTATASSGYEFINWTLEGVEVSTSLTYVPAKVDGLNVPATYVANFRALGDITINYEATTGGTVSRASESMNPETGVAQGSTATASSGYEFINWTLEGVEVSTSLTYVPAKVDDLNAPATYVANFKAIEVPPTYYTVTYAPGTQGTFTPKVTENLLAGAATPAAPATPGNSGFTFNGWSPTPTATVTGNATYTAQWRANTPPPPQLYNLTIVYVYSFGDTARPAYNAQLQAGQTYRVLTPTIPGYTPNADVVAGTMPEDSIRIVVTYTRIPTTTERERERDPDPEVIITPEPIPLAPPPVVIPPVIVEVVPTEPIPQAPILPRTGTFGAGEAAGIGALLMAIGIMLKRKKDE